MKLLLIGDLCADLIVPYGEARKKVEKLKLCTEMNKPETYKEGTVSFQGGGSVANTARILGKLGANPYFLTNLGNDEAGRFLKKEMESYGVNLSYSPVVDHGSVLCIAVVDEKGERTMFTWVPPWAEYDTFDTGIFQEVEKESPCMIYSGGMAITNDAKSGENLISFFKRRKEAGSKILFDVNLRAESYGFTGSRKKQMMEMTGIADVLFGSGLEEFSPLSGEDTLDRAMEKMKKKNQILIMRDGKNPIRVWDGQHLSIHQVPQVIPINTVGAGDFFNGAFLKAYQDGKSVVFAVDYAARIASYVISHSERIKLPDKISIE